MSAKQSSKILSVDDLVAVRDRLRREGKVVVQCHGCFDIVHPGHIRYLKFAREQGDVLIVSVSGDAVVGKGVDRPYITEDLRLENLSALEIVDYVCVDHHDWAGPILDTLRPDVYVKGKEYEASADPRFAKERSLVEEYGGTVIFSSGEVVYSSTFILDQYRSRFRLEDDKIRAFCQRHGIDRARVREVLRRFTSLKVLVIGDPILDCYVHCNQASVAAEGPILDVTPLREDWYLGAAALMAAQAAALGAAATLLHPRSTSSEAARLSQALTHAGVEPLTFGAEERPVFLKYRYLVDETKVFKVNHGHYAPLSTAGSRALVGLIRTEGGLFDGWLVSDFGYGLFGQAVVEGVTSLARELGKPFFFDVSQAGAGNLLRFQEPRVASPTEEELRFAFGDRESGLSNLAKRYFDETRAANLVITLGKRGAVLFEPPKAGASRLVNDYLPALRQMPIDAVGAGDVFMTLVTLVQLAGGSMPEAVYLAAAAAALHVGRLGNEVVGLADLEAWLDRRPELDG